MLALRRPLAVRIAGDTSNALATALSQHSDAMILRSAIIVAKMLFQACRPVLSAKGFIVPVRTPAGTGILICSEANPHIRLLGQPCLI